MEISETILDRVLDSCAHAAIFIVCCRASPNFLDLDFDRSCAAGALGRDIDGHETLGVEQQLRPAGDTELVKNSKEIVLDRVLAQLEVASDFTI